MTAHTRATRTPVRRLTRFTPLRYPGGKGKLAGFIKRLIEINGLSDGEYVEPYAGGAAVALELLFHEYVSRVHINDISLHLYAFWKSVLDETEGLVRRIRETPLTVEEWDRQKRIFSNRHEHDELAVGFATFYLNRTNRSGILNGGIIGGRDQSGPWKINARFNAEELIYRIESIAKMRGRILLTTEDAYTFLARSRTTLPKNTLIYLDPPYYCRGKDLYYDYYEHADHEKIERLVRNKITRQKWIVSYDNARAIRQIYSHCRHVTYSIGYSAREVRDGREIMYFSEGLSIPPLKDSLRKSRSSARVAAGAT